MRTRVDYLAMPHDLASIIQMEGGVFVVSSAAKAIRNQVSMIIGTAKEIKAGRNGQVADTTHVKWGGDIIQCSAEVLKNAELLDALYRQGFGQKR